EKAWRRVNDEPRAKVVELAQCTERRLPAGDLVEAERHRDAFGKLLQAVEAAHAIDEHRVCSGLGECDDAFLDFGRIAGVGTRDNVDVAAGGKNGLELREIFFKLHDEFAIEVPAASGALLVLEDDTGCANFFERRSHMAGDFRVAIAVIDGKLIMEL